eukprot:scaffold7601_cov417-Prasinococcus_capsulatus_cf.AAC.13
MTLARLGLPRSRCDNRACRLWMRVSSADGVVRDWACNAAVNGVGAGGRLASLGVLVALKVRVRSRRHQRVPLARSLQAPCVASAGSLPPQENLRHPPPGGWWPEGRLESCRPSIALSH